MKPNSIWQPQHPRVHNELDFNISDPNLYNCAAFRYTRSLRHLIVVVHDQISNPKPAFYLSFESVWYFQGPMSWASVDFELSDTGERKKLLQKGIVEIADNMIDAFAQQYELFTIRKPAFNIQILAGNCAILKSISPL